MIFQIIDNKKECATVYYDGNFCDYSQALSLTKTWAPSEHEFGHSIEYAQIWCAGKSLMQMCPDDLKSRWTYLNNKANSFLKSFKITKINLEHFCLFDVLPSTFLQEFLEVKNQITQHVFQSYEKPDNYDFLCDLIQFLKALEAKDLNIDHNNLDFSSEAVRNSFAKIKNCNKKILYNPWKTVTGRLTTNKNSFPILTLNKELRPILKPNNDLFVELDYNSAELRVMLFLLGQAQPKQDIHMWISQEVFQGKYTREQTKKKVFAWLYNPKAKNKKLNSHFDRDKILANYYVDGYVNTPFGRRIKADESKAVNYLIQSTTSDLLLKSAIEISKKLKHKKSYVAFCIHDSLVIDFCKEDKHLISDLTSLFSNTKLDNFSYNLSIGKNFGEMRSIQ